MFTVPLMPNWDEASMTLVASARNDWVVIEMLPPCPCVALATIWLFCSITACGSMTMLPPTVVVEPCTEALSWLLVSRTLSVARTVMFPPLACVASVVTELFVLVNVCPALIVIFPALAGLVLLAATLAPSLNVNDWPAVRTISPPAPELGAAPTVRLKMPAGEPSLKVPDSVITFDALIATSPPRPVLVLPLLIWAPLPSVNVPVLMNTRPALPQTPEHKSLPTV